VLEAVRHCLSQVEHVRVVGVALSTQRESVVGWRASTGEPLGPVIGWQDSRTADWCAEAFDDTSRGEVHRRTGLRVDAMFSAPKLRWILHHLAGGVPFSDVRLGTIDAWLIWQLTGGAQHLCEAGNASRTLLYDVTALAWSPVLLDIFDVPAQVLPVPLPSDADFGRCTGAGLVADGTPILAVMADSHAALFGQGCTEVGMAKATYGTGSSVMTPVTNLPLGSSPVPTTLAWLTGGTPTYALEGNILSSGATLAWAAGLLTSGDVPALISLAETVPDSDGVTLVPAFSGLGAPHWDRHALALFSGMTTRTGAAHLARAAVDSIAHQICDVVDVIEQTSGPLGLLRADGGATASQLVMQTQADLLDRLVDVADVAEVSALGAAKLAWEALGRSDDWPQHSPSRRYTSTVTSAARSDRRDQWSAEVARACFPAARRQR
jgi:glycerol kinase